MDYREKIFKMLGVKPDEEFKLKNTKSNKCEETIYRLREDLMVELYVTETWWANPAILPLLLTGKLKITKIIKPTKYEVITLCGSTKFKDTFIKAQKELTLQGKRNKIIRSIIFKNIKKI